MRTVQRFGAAAVMVILLGAFGSPALAQDASPSPAAAGPWTSVALPPVSGDASHPQAVASDGDSLVATGRASCTPDGACVGEAWTSPDGQAWSAIGSDAGLSLDTDGDGSLDLIDVAFGPAGYVAIGQPAVLWQSADGQAWERVGVDLALPPNGTMTAITATPDGYLAVGAARGGKRARAVVWSSSDALTWTEVPESEALKAGLTVDLGGGTVGSGGMTAVASVPGGFIAAGGICRPPTSNGDAVDEEAVATVSGVLVAEVHARLGCRPAVWRSADGQAWEREILGKAPRLAVTDAVMGLRGLAVLGDVVVVAETGPSGPTLTILKGSEATRVDLMRKDDVETLWSLGTIGDRFLAVGVPLRGAFGMWTSADGLDWKPVADLPVLPENANVITGTDIGGSADHAVVVGSAAETYEGGAEVGFSVVGPVEPYLDTSP